MATPLFDFLLLLSLSAPCLALEFNLLPTKTSSTSDGPDYWGWSPKPTDVRKPFDLLKRQDTPPALCGFISGVYSNSLTCPAGQYCGWLNDQDAVGCCTSYYTADNGVVSLTGCFYHTVCWDSSYGSSACGTDTECAWCGSSAYPYCYEITFTDTPGMSFGCTNSPSLIVQAGVSYNNAIGGGSSTTSTSSTTISSTSSSTTPFSTSSTSSPYVSPSTTSSSSTGASSASESSGLTTTLSPVYSSTISTSGTAPASVSLGQSSVGPSSAATPIPAPTGGNTGISTSTTTASGTGAFASSSTPAPTSSSSSSSSHTGAIVGGVVGGVVGLAIIAGLLFFLLRRRKHTEEPQPATTPQYAHPYSPEPHSIEPSSAPTSPPMSQAAYSPISHGGTGGYQYQGLHPHGNASELPGQTYGGGPSSGYQGSQWSANTGYRGY